MRNISRTHPVVEADPAKRLLLAPRPERVHPLRGPRGFGKGREVRDFQQTKENRTGSGGSMILALLCLMCTKDRAPNSMTDPGVQDWPKDGLQSLQNGENSVLKIGRGSGNG
jgi:hypothetical protein